MEDADDVREDGQVLAHTSQPVGCRQREQIQNRRHLSLGLQHPSRGKGDCRRAGDEHEPQQQHDAARRVEPAEPGERVQRCDERIAARTSGIQRNHQEQRPECGEPRQSQEALGRVVFETFRPADHDVEQATDHACNEEIFENAKQHEQQTKARFRCGGDVDDFPNDRRVGGLDVCCERGLGTDEQREIEGAKAANVAVDHPSDRALTSRGNRRERRRNGLRVDGYDR